VTSISFYGTIILSTALRISRVGLAAFAGMQPD
jgi:hypothetical protein